MKSISEEQPQGYLLQRAPGLLLVNDTPKGRGIFTTLPIPTNTTLEISPVLLFTPSEVTNHTSQTTLAHYTYNWPSPTGSGPPVQAIALGLGSMFNHSRLRQNVVWTRDVQRGVIVYQACRDIEVGEELCISYGERLWFRDTEGEEGSDAEGEGERDGFERSGLGDIVIEDEEGEVK